MKNNTYVVGYLYDENGKRTVSIRLHNLILQPAEGLVADHINRNGRDNRRNNLRPVTRSENATNTGMRATNTSGVKGVSFDSQREKWQVRIALDGTKYNFGHYATKEVATPIATLSLATYHAFSDERQMYLPALLDAVLDVITEDHQNVRMRRMLEDVESLIFDGTEPMINEGRAS